MAFFFNLTVFVLSIILCKIIKCNLTCHEFKDCACHSSETNFKLRCPKSFTVLSLSMNKILKETQIVCSNETIRLPLRHFPLYGTKMIFINCLEKYYFQNVMHRFNTNNAATAIIFKNLDQSVSNRPPVVELSYLKGISRLQFVNYSIEVQTPVNLWMLRELKIKSCTIKFEKLFCMFPNLSKLDLSGNDLMNTVMFKIESPLSLSAYNLVNTRNFLDEYTFESLNHLKYLDLSLNSLWTIRVGYFSHLKEVEEINISSNLIRTIEKGAFAMNKKLTVLNMSNNLLFTHPYLENVKILDLSHNRITQLLDEWLKSTDISIIDASFNNISNIDWRKIEGAFSQNITFNLNQTMKIQDTNNKFITTRFLKGNPIEHDIHLLNLIQFYADLKADKSLEDIFDPHKLNCKQQNRYLCSLRKHEEFCVPNCTCLLAPREYSFIVNCTKRLVGATILPKLNAPNLWKTEMYLDHNIFTVELAKNMGYENVTKLDLSHNCIQNVTWLPFQKLEVLNIDNNKINRLSKFLVESLNQSAILKHISIHNNPWACNCESFDWISAMKALIEHKHINAERIMCSSGNFKIVNLTLVQLCSIKQKLMFILLLSSTGMVILVAFLTLCYRYKYDINVFLYTHGLCLKFITKNESNDGKEYDAFICYSYKDEQFLVKHLLPALEGGPKRYKICIHVRNWVPGELITMQIKNSIETSRRTIVIMSPNFLKSKWSMVEFRMAHTRAIENCNKSLIIIQHERIDVSNVRDGDLKECFKMHPFIKWKELRFWEKLKYALPHHSLYEI